VEHPQALPAQAHLVEERPDVLDPALRAAAPLDIGAVLLGAGDDAHQVRARLERLQEVLRL
jgi:hypothetical protein